jgi:hypothetical protein
MNEMTQLLTEAKNRFQSNLEKMKGKDVNDQEYMTLLNANLSLADRIQYLSTQVKSEA